MPDRKINSTMQATQVFIESIDKNPSLPDHAKQELKRLVSDHCRLIGQIIGTTELMYLREKQHPQE